MEEERVSGNIFASKCGPHEKDELYVIRNQVTNHGWGVPTDDIEPDDLRALADRIEKLRG